MQKTKISCCFFKSEEQIINLVVQVSTGSYPYKTLNQCKAVMNEENVVRLVMQLNGWRLGWRLNERCSMLRYEERCCETCTKRSGNKNQTWSVVRKEMEWHMDEEWGDAWKMHKMTQGHITNNSCRTNMWNAARTVWNDIWIYREWNMECSRGKYMDARRAWIDIKRESGMRQGLHGWCTESMDI